MLLTITNNAQPATDLGFLLHKHPERCQSFELAFGEARVFYPEASETRCTAALLLDIDPIALTRGRQRGRGQAESDTALFDHYVNERPYVASSFMSVAIAQVFGSALAGRCAGREELVESALPLQATITALPCRGAEDLPRRLFEPLGYAVNATSHPLDTNEPAWGDSPYFTITLSAQTRLQDLLAHLYVLIPVLDDAKHYWVAFDCEIMPWSAKAQELIRQQYAPVGAAAHVGLTASLDALEQAERRGIAVEPLRQHFAERLEQAHRYADAYRRYCWPVASIADLKIAPFHLLATEGTTHVARDHGWHMATIAEICTADPDLLLATDHRIVDVTDVAAQLTAISWWEALTQRGGEGAVVKPLEFIATAHGKLLQPAIKCRGHEYLRIIYGPEYDTPAHLATLRQRGLGRKRSLALREFALQRFAH